MVWVQLLYKRYKPSSAPLVHAIFSSSPTSLFILESSALFSLVLSRPSPIHLVLLLFARRLSAMRFTIQCTAMALAITAVAAAPFPKPAEPGSAVAYEAASPRIGISPIAVQVANRKALPLDAELAEDAAKGGESLLSKIMKGVKKYKWNLGITGATMLPSLFEGSGSKSQPQSSGSS